MSPRTFLSALAMLVAALFLVLVAAPSWSLSQGCSPAQQAAERKVLDGVLIAADIACAGFVVRAGTPLERDACIAEGDLAPYLRARLALDAGTQ